MVFRNLGLMWVLVLLVSGCAWLKPDIQTPKVTLDSLEMLPVSGLNQRFKIGLRLSNPNDRSLKFNGISYTVVLNGYQLIDGVGNDIPEVEAFSEVLFYVQASTNMLETLRFINNFMGGKASGDLNYRLRGDISVAGLPRRLSVEESGTVPLFSEQQ